MPELDDSPRPHRSPRGRLLPPPPGITPTAVRREASGYFTGLREIAATPDEERRRTNAKDRVEVCFFHEDHAEKELVRLTVDLRPWEEVIAEARAGTVTPEDVELLEVNATHAPAGGNDEAISQDFVSGYFYP